MIGANLVKSTGKLLAAGTKRSVKYDWAYLGGRPDEAAIGTSVGVTTDPGLSASPFNRRTAARGRQRDPSSRS
jgi:hypothetical protein